MIATIEVKGLTKTYLSRSPSGKSVTITAVKDLYFEIVEGETVAFLGPNGAGKSTTIKMLCGILSPSAGFARVLGEVAGSRSANAKLGLVFGTRSQLYLHMTVAQCLDLAAETYFLTGALKRERIATLSERFEITRFLPLRVRTLSLGERMRCEIVAALLHRPRVLLADEPTIGLDVVAKSNLRRLIRSWQREERTTLLLTSHDLSDVEELCDRSILIDQGEKRFDGKLKNLKGDLKSVRRLSVTVDEIAALPFESHPKISFQGSREEGWVHPYEISLDTISMPEALASLSNHYGSRVRDISVSEVSLEEVMRGLFMSSRGGND